VIPKPFQVQALVAKRPVERFVCAIMPGLARIDEPGIDPDRLDPSQQRQRHEFGSII
jgi:hypothetical protein